jgi:release factor glutamine methyltransferase
MKERIAQLHTPREALVWASSLLSAGGLNPKVAEWILMDLLSQDKTRFLAGLDDPLPPEQGEAYHAKIKRVAQGEPYQYVLGSAEFYGRSFVVNPAVLIPRPETELLVEEVLKAVAPLAEQKSLCIVDVGTGSGAIAITLDLELKERLAQKGSLAEVDILAVDISEPALEVARLNAARLGAKVTFLHSDLLTGLIKSNGKVDVLVSNPPYVSVHEQDLMDPSVLGHEPHLALFAGEDGLFFYRKIIQQSLTVLNQPGWLAFEVGANQAEAVQSIIAQAYPQAVLSTKRDWQGHKRVVMAKIG